MRDRVHEVRLSESHAGVEEERVVDLTRRFGNGKRGSMGKLVVAAYDEGVECILRVQVRFLHHFREVVGLLVLHRGNLVRRDVADIEV